MTANRFACHEHPPEVHLPGDGPMRLGGVRLELLGEPPEAGAAGQAAQLSQHELRMQVRVLPLAARLLQARKPPSQPSEDDVSHACENLCTNHPLGARQVLAETSWSLLAMQCRGGAISP